MMGDMNMHLKRAESKLKSEEEQVPVPFYRRLGGKQNWKGMPSVSNK